MEKKFGGSVDYSNTANSTNNNDDSVNYSVGDNSRHRWAQAHRMMWMPNAECPPTTLLLGSDNEYHEDEETRQSFNIQEKEMEKEATMTNIAEKAKTRKPEFSSSAIVLPHGHLAQMEETESLQEHVLAHNKTPTKASNITHTLLNKLSNKVLMACYNYSSSSSYPSQSSSTKGSTHKPLLSNTLLTELKEVLDDETTETYVRNLITAVIALSEPVHDKDELAVNVATENHERPDSAMINSKNSLEQQHEEHEEQCNKKIIMAVEARNELELILEETCRRLGCNTDILNGHDMLEKKSYKWVYCDLVGVIEECTQRVSEIKRMYCYDHNIITANTENSDKNHDVAHSCVDENRVNGTSATTKEMQTTQNEKREAHQVALQSNKCVSLLETLQETYELIACHSTSEGASSARTAQRTLSEMADILESYGAVSHYTNMPSVLLRVVNELEQLRRSRQFDELLIKEYEHSVHDRFATYGEVHPPCVCDEVERLVQVQNMSEQHKIAHDAAVILHDKSVKSLSQVAKPQTLVWLEHPLQELLHDISHLSSSTESLPSMEQLLLLSSLSSLPPSSIISSVNSSSLLFATHNAEQTQFNVRHAIELARQQLQQWKEEAKEHEYNSTCINTTTTSHNDTNNKTCKESEIGVLDNVENGSKTNTECTECKDELANKEEMSNREQMLARNTVHELINTIPLSLQIKLNLRSSDSFTNIQAHKLKDVMQSLLHEHLTQEESINIIRQVIYALQKNLQTLKVEQGTWHQLESQLAIASSLLPSNSSWTEEIAETIESTVANTQCNANSAVTDHRPLYAPLMSSIHELHEVSNQLTKEINLHLEHLHDGVYTASQAEVKHAVHKLAEMLVMETGNVISGVSNTFSNKKNNNKQIWPSTQTLVEPPSHKLSDMIALVHASWLETLQASQRQQLQLMHVNAEKARIQRSATKYITEMSIIMNEMCSTFAKMSQANSSGNGNNNNNNKSNSSAQLTTENIEECEKNNKETTILEIETQGQQQSVKTVHVNGVVSSPHASYSSSEPLSSSSSESLLLMHTKKSAALSDNLTSSQAEEHLRMLTERLKMLKVKSTRAVEQLNASRARVENLTINTNTTQRRMRKVAASVHNICHTLSIAINSDDISKGNAEIPVISEVEMIRLLRLIELRVKGNDTLQETSLREGKIVELEREIEQCRSNSVISTATLKAILCKLQTDGQIIKSALYLIGTDESANDDLLDEITRFVQTDLDTIDNQNKNKNNISNKNVDQVNLVHGAKLSKRKPDFDVSVFSETSSEDETKYVMTENKHNTTNVYADEKVEELLAMLMQKYTRWTERLREGIDEHLYSQQKITRYVGAMCRFISSAASQSLLRNVPERSNKKIFNMDVSKLNNLIDIDDMLMQYADNVLPELDRMLSMSERRKANKKSSTNSTNETENVLDKLLRSTNSRSQEELLKESEQLGLPPVPSNASSRAQQSQTTKSTKNNNNNNFNTNDEYDENDVEDVNEEVSQGDYVSFRASDILPYDIRLEKLHEMMIKLHTILSSLHRVHYLAIPVAERVRRSGDVELIFDDSEDVNDTNSIYDKFVDVGDNNTTTISGGGNGEREKDMRSSSSQNRKTARNSVNSRNEKIGFVNIDLVELVQSCTEREMKRSELDSTTDKVTSRLPKRKPDKFAREYTPPVHPHSFTTSEINLESGNDGNSWPRVPNDSVRERNAQIDSHVSSQKDYHSNNNGVDDDNDDDEDVDENRDDKLMRLMNNEVILKVLTHNAECLYNSAKKFSSMYKSAAIIIQKDTDALQSLLSSMLERYSELDVEHAFQQNRNELLAMYSVLSEKGTKAKGCYFFTRVNGDGPCVWTAALEKLNAGFGTIIDKLVERTELITRYRNVIDHVSNNCLEYVNWAMASQLAELQLPAAITEKCSSTENTDKGHMESNHVDDGNKVEKATDSEKNGNTTTHENERELFNALPPMPTEMPTLTPLEKLLAESTIVQLPENNLENHTATANTDDVKIEVENENVIAETGKDDRDYNNNNSNKRNDNTETAKVTHFTEDNVLASVVHTLFDQLKLFVARYQSHDMSNETQNKVALLQEELQTLTRQNQTLEDERDKALSSAAVARTELRRWLRQNGLNEESAALLDKTMHSAVTPPLTTTAITSSKTPQLFEDNKGNNNNNKNNKNNKTTPYKDEEMKNINNARERTEKLKSSIKSTHSADDQLQVMLSPPTEVTPVEPHTIPFTHALYNHPLASLHMDQESTSPIQLEAIRQYLCALNAQLEFAEMAIGKHKKPTNLTSSLHLQHHQNDKTNRRKSESIERRSVAYQSDDSSSSCNSDEEVEPATTSANMAHAKDMDLVVTPSPHRYAIQYNLRQESNAWKHDTKEGRYHNITTTTTFNNNNKDQRCRRHNNNNKHTHEEEEERQTRSVSSTQMQRERRDALTHSHDNKTTNNYNNRSRSRSARTDRSRSRSSMVKVHDNIHKKEEETNADQLFNERQKARAVRHQIEKNRHFPPSHQEEEQQKYEKQHEYNVHSLTPKCNAESHSRRSTSNANRVIDSNSSKNECNYEMKNKESKEVSNTNSNNVTYFKLTPSETRRLLRQSHTRSPDGKHQTNRLSMSREEQQHRPVRKESVNKRESNKSKHNESYITDEDHGHHLHGHRHRRNSNTKRQLQQLQFDDYTNSIGPDLFENSQRHSKLSYY